LGALGYQLMAGDLVHAVGISNNIHCIKWDVGT
jgi:hypothetical protein